MNSSMAIREVLLFGAGGGFAPAWPGTLLLELLEQRVPFLPGFERL
ncbi:hypothetical protein NAV33_00045 [Pseudomonas stutzeri]|nr:hypothetical protein [Stutzerimonas stutzeri]MCQ4310292.1 hypothetical protein [Stutzerimonas stutzeri]